MSILVKFLIIIHELECSMQESIRKRKSRIELPKVETKIPIPPPPPVLSWVDSLIDHTNLNDLQTLYLPLEALLIGGRNRLRKVPKSDIRDRSNPMLSLAGPLESLLTEAKSQLKKVPKSDIRDRSKPMLSLAVSPVPSVLTEQDTADTCDVSIK